MPWPRQSDRYRSGLRDRELWVVLCALVAHRPVLTVVIEPRDVDTPTAKAAVASIVCGLDELAEEVGMLLPSGLSGGVGSAQEVGASVVRLCRFFTDGWSRDGMVTAGRAAQFNREVELLEVCLDGIATRFVDRSH